MAEGYTRLQLQTKVRDVLRDDAAADADRAVQDSEIQGWLDEAQLDIAWRTETFRKEVAATWGATYQLPAPADLIRVLQLRLGTDDVAFVNDQVFWDWKDSTGTPSVPVGRVFGSNLE